MLEHTLLMPKETISVRDTAVADAFEQAAIQDWLPLEMTQLSKGDYQGHVRIIDHQDVSVTFESQNRTVHKRGVISDGVCTVSFFREKNHQHRFSKYRPKEHSLFLLPSTSEFDIHVPENTNTVYFKLDQQFLIDKLRAINPYAWEREQNDLLILDRVDRRALNDLTEFLLSSNAVAGESKVNLHLHQAQLGNIIIDQIVMAMNAFIPSEQAHSKQEHPERISLGRARGVVNRFIEYVEAAFQLQRCPSVVDTCVELQISQRTLQYSFKQLLGITPIAYLRYHRLNKVRYQLLNARDEQITVTDIAMQWHFLHLGKFSDDYHQMFGELPSNTLRRARRYNLKQQHS